MEEGNSIGKHGEDGTDSGRSVNVRLKDEVLVAEEVSGMMNFFVLSDGLVSVASE